MRINIRKPKEVFVENFGSDGFRCEYFKFMTPEFLTRFSLALSKL